MLKRFKTSPSKVNGKKIIKFYSDVGQERITVLKKNFFQLFVINVYNYAR